MPNQSAAANRRPAGQSDGSGNLTAIVAADRAFLHSPQYCYGGRAAAVAVQTGMKTNANAAKGFTVLELLVVVAVLASGSCLARGQSSGQIWTLPETP